MGQRPTRPTGKRCSPEPWAYANGFTFQELMRKQIYASELPFAGPLDDYPLIMWGPYIWANGSTPNATILAYEAVALAYYCWHWCVDGGHPSSDSDACGHQSGRALISELLYNFFFKDAVATDWFRPRPARRSSTPVNATIDRLQDFKRVGQTLVEQGTTQITFAFTDEVRDANDDQALDAESFEVFTTCPSSSEPGCSVTPSVIDVYQTTADPRVYVLTLDHQITPGQWTTIEANVELAAEPHTAIRYAPLDRVVLGFLPGDTNADNVVNLNDYHRLENILNGNGQEDLSLHDINRDGDVTTADLVRLRELLQGTNTTRAWNNYELPDPPLPTDCP